MKDSFQSPANPVIPDHQLIRRIGEGSYGEIWLAKTVIGIYRAVKIVYRARFETNRPYDREFKGIQKFEPISRTHTGLVDILQIGRNDDAGYFYYVMELADDEKTGKVIHPETYSAKTLGKELAAHARLPAAESLRLGQHLAAALAHMHKHGLVHRDVKPSNIIFVGGEPKLADIGLVELVTAAGTYVGTEGYIPPEGPGSIQADIYSLGKVLYEISTGQERDAFPALPERLNDFADSDAVIELNEVVVKACANSPSTRYTNADDLRSDLEMVASGRSVKRLRSMERQLRRALRLAAFAGVVAVVAVAAISIINQRRAAERKLLAQAYVADGARRMEEGNFHGALPVLAEAAHMEEDDTTAQLTHRTRLGSILTRSPRLLQFWQMESGMNDARFSPDGKRLLISGLRGARLLDIESGEVLKEFPSEEAASSAVFSPDGKRVAIVHGRFVRVQELSADTNLFMLSQHDKATSVEFSPDGELLLVACGKGCAHLLEARDGRSNGERLRANDSVLSCAVFSPDGSLILTGSRDGTARIWDAETRETLHVLKHAGWVLSAAFSPDGRRVATASSDGSLRTWNVADGVLLLAGMQHRGGVCSVRYSPDGRHLVSTGFDQTVRFWETRLGKPAGALLNLRSVGMRAEFDAEAQRLVVAEFAGDIKAWNIVSPSPVSAGPAIVSGNRERYVAYSSNTFTVRSARDDKLLVAERTAPGEIAGILCSDTADRILVRTRDEENRASTIHVFEADATAMNIFNVPALNSPSWLNANGARLLTTAAREIYLWDVTRGQLIWGPKDYSAPIHLAVFSPDGRALALATETNGVLMVDVRTGEPLLSPLPVGQRVRAMEFSPNSSRLVTATSDPGFVAGAAQIWDAHTGRRVGAPMMHTDGLSDVRFSTNGQMIVTTGEDSRARVWNGTTGASITDPTPLFAPGTTVEFSANGRWIITGTWFAVQVREASTGLPVTMPFTDTVRFERAGFCAGDARVWVQTARDLLFWDLPQHSARVEDLIPLTTYLGVRVPSSIPHTPFTPAQMRERCAAERARSTAALDGWQRGQARRSEGTQDWFSALFYWRRLLARNPQNPELRVQMEQARARWEISNPAASVRRENSR